MDYRFVKIKRGDKSSWWFNPRTEEQLLEHFEKIFGAEIRDGVQDYIQSCHKVADKSEPEGYWIYHAHPVTPFNKAVEAITYVHGGYWIAHAASLENQVLNNRVKAFERGDEMYLDNGVVETRLVNGDEIIEERFEDDLIYPVETQCRIEDVRYMQWNEPEMGIKGSHWYAKIGKTDIRDKEGNMKWDTKKEAEKAAKWFIYNKIQNNRYND